mmetsp:Transcript_79285/g.230252  ORF Transcript_79285/g.230252 Transcript_79285/m.230252 type:complete len:241 (+) Transcript_79285:279-1001(+)
MLAASPSNACWCCVWQTPPTSPPPLLLALPLPLTRPSPRNALSPLRRCNGCCRRRWDPLPPLLSLPLPTPSTALSVGNCSALSLPLARCVRCSPETHGCSPAPPWLLRSPSALLRSPPPSTLWRSRTSALPAPLQLLPAAAVHVDNTPAKTSSCSSSSAIANPTCEGEVLTSSRKSRSTCSGEVPAASSQIACNGDDSTAQSPLQSLPGKDASRRARRDASMAWAGDDPCRSAIVAAGVS